MFHCAHWYPHHNREHVCVSRGWIQGRADISHYLETLWTSASTALLLPVHWEPHCSLCTTFPCTTFTQCWSSTHCKQLTNSRPPSLEPWRCLSFWSSVQLGAFYQLFNPSLLFNLHSSRSRANIRKLPSLHWPPLDPTCIQWIFLLFQCFFNTFYQILLWYHCLKTSARVVKYCRISFDIFIGRKHFDGPQLWALLQPNCYYASL